MSAATTYRATAQIGESTMDVFSLHTPLGASIYSANLGAELILVGRQFGVGVTADELERKVVSAEVVTLSSDGKAWTDGWHTGPESGDVAYVEKATRGGSTFHGYVDTVSRRVVQAG